MDSKVDSMMDSIRGRRSLRSGGGRDRLRSFGFVGSAVLAHATRRLDDEQATCHARVTNGSEQRYERGFDVTRGRPRRRPDDDDSGVARRRVPHGVGEVSVESDERASVRGAHGDQGLVGRQAETLTLGSGHIMPSINEKPAPACAEIGVQLELHDA